AIRRRFASLGDSLVKVVVTHHPFDLPDDPAHDERVGRAGLAMEVFADCGVDLLVAGHFHTSQAGTSARAELPGYSALVVQAGTATSTRGRGESNAFNVMRIETDAISVERHVWRPDPAIFVLETTDHFERRDALWIER
ncbi:MAG: metallophosphoesterase, partial [Caldimonas sp.]